MPPKTDVPMAVMGAATPLASARQHTAAKRERRHDNGRNRRRVPSRCGLDQAQALFVARLGKLDDQNGVLRGETERGQQANLEIDVIGQSAQQEAITPPSTPSGNASRIETGMGQLS